MLLVLWLATEGIVGQVQKWLRGRVKGVSPSLPGILENKTVKTPLQISDLSIAFGGVKAATNVGFTARPGEVTSLIGPNGAGKTTVLNMLSGFYTPQSGAIKLGDRNIEGIAAWRVARAGLARTYQTSQLFGSLTVLENLVIATPERSGSEAAAERLLAFVGYRGDLHARAADLPHVDRRLVEIARALATRPAVLLLDEPAAGLARADKETRARLMGRIAQAGVTVLLVEHDMAIVMGISNHVVVLDAGTPIAEGTPQQVQQDPAVRKAYLGGAHAKQKENVSAKSAGAILLEVGKLEAGYGAEPVLKGIDLRVNAGELVGVPGATGA